MKLNREKWFTQQETRDMLDTIKSSCKNENLKMIMLVGYSCGMRISEILSIKVSQVYDEETDTAKSYFDVLGKRKSLYRVHINVTLQESLMGFINGYKRYKGHPLGDAPLFLSNYKKPLSYSAAVSSLKRWMKKLNLPMRNFHQMRHSYISLLANHPDAGVVIAKFKANHSNLQTTSIYVHATEEQLVVASEIASF